MVLEQTLTLSGCLTRKIADVLDKALMRAGRFDRQIDADLPDIRERKEIFEVHLAPLKKVEGLDTDFLAKQTPGSGGQIAMFVTKRL